MRVKWEGGDRSWMKESDLQELYPDALYAYWNSKGGRTTETRIDMYHVFKITKKRNKRKNGGRESWVQWLGYHENEGEWIAEGKLRSEHEAGALVDEYLPIVK